MTFWPNTVVELRGRMEEGRNAAGRREDNLDTLTHRHQSASVNRARPKVRPQRPHLFGVGENPGNIKTLPKILPQHPGFLMCLRYVCRIQYVWRNRFSFY